MFSLFQENQQRMKSLIGEVQVAGDQEDLLRKKLRDASQHIIPSDVAHKAGLPEAQRQKVTLGVLVAFTVLVATALVGQAPVLLLFVPLLPIAIRIWLSSLTAKRVEGFDKDFAALLLSIASSLRAGVDATAALERSVHLFPKESVMHEELDKFVRNIASGETEERAISRFGEDIGHPDIELFRRSFLLSRRQGGSLSMCLQRLARFTRQRQSFRRKIKSALAMQKLSAFGIAGCALLIIIMQAVSQTKTLISAYHNPLGFRMLMLGLFLITVGIVGMLRLSTYRGDESV